MESTSSMLTDSTSTGSGSNKPIISDYPENNYSLPFLITDILLTLLSIIPNYVCFHHIYRRCFREPIIRNYLYLSLITTTCITSTLGNPIYLITKTIGLPKMMSTPKAEYNLCALLLAVYLCPMGAVSATLVCIAIEQAIAVTVPDKVRQRTKKETRVITLTYIVTSWTISAFSGCSLLIFPDSQRLFHDEERPFEKCYFEEVLSNKMLCVYLSCSFYIPLIVLTILTIIIYHKLTKLEQPNDDSTACPKELKERQYQKAAKMLVILSSFYVLTWTPLALARTIQLFYTEFSHHLPSWMLNSTVIVWHLSTLFNPLFILYKEYNSGKYRPPTRLMTISFTD